MDRIKFAETIAEVSNAVEKEGLDSGRLGTGQSIMTYVRINEDDIFIDGECVQSIEQFLMYGQLVWMCERMPEIVTDTLRTMTDRKMETFKTLEFWERFYETAHEILVAMGKIPNRI